MNQVEKDYEFHKERCLYYKRLRDITSNPTLYVELDNQVKYHLYKVGFLSQQLKAFERCAK